MPRPQDSRGSAERAGSALALAWGLLLVPLGYFVPLPGVDDAIANQMLGRLELAFLPVIGAFGATIPSYAIVRFLARPYSGPRAQRIACGVYLLLAFLQALGIAIWLEDMGSGFDGIVASPGWAFRLGVALTWTAGAAIVWASGAWIDRVSVAHGPLFLLFGYTLTHRVVDGFGLGAGLAYGTVSLSSAAAWSVLPLALLVLAVLLLVRPIGGWPLTLYRWTLRSPWDVLAVATVAVVPTSVATTLVNVMGEPLPAWWGWIEASLSLALGVLLVAWAFRNGRGDGSDPRRRAPAAVTLASALAIAASFGLAFVLAGGVQRANLPDPLEGEQSFELELEADESFASTDSDAVQHRLSALGARVQASGVSAQRISLRVDAALSERAVIDALAPNALAIHEGLDVLEEGHPSVAQLPGFPLRSSSGSVSVAAACLPLFSWLRHTPDDERCLYRIEETEAGCVLHCVSAEPIVGSDDVVDADVIFGSDVSVRAHLSSEASERFGAATRRLIGRRIVILVDDFVLSAPEIVSPITGGALTLWTTYESDPAQARLEAEVFAESLRPASRMRGSWHLAE